MERRGTPRRGGPGTLPSWPVILLAYTVAFAVVTVLEYLITGDALGAIGPFAGGLMGLLLLRTSRLQRFVSRWRRGRWGAGPPEDRWR